MLARTLPATRGRERPVIDYLGAGLLAAGLSAIVLVTSLGGTTWRWGGAQRSRSATLGVALLVAFVARRAPRTRARAPAGADARPLFAVAAAMSLIVGFALFGSVTFLPLYFQTVERRPRPAPGLRLIPMMAALLTMSIVSGQTISRTGRYRAFPIAGTARDDRCAARCSRASTSAAPRPGRPRTCSCSGSASAR